MEHDPFKLPDKEENTFEWADYVELACLFNIDKEQTKSDIIDKIGKAKSWVDEHGNTINQSRLDNLETRVDGYFSHISYRSNHFMQSYPFDISDDENKISLKAELSTTSKIYIYMLCAANLRFFKEEMHELTGGFEHLSYLAVKNWLPQSMNVIIFGTANDNQTKYEGNRYQRLCSLADDLCAKMIEDEGDYSSGHGGDEGIDIVVFHSFSDKNPGSFVMFGQCACSPSEWDKKQYSVHPDTLRQKFHLKSNYISVTFIPQCYRDTNNSWPRNNRINTLLIDRLRMLELIDGSPEIFNDVPSRSLVDQVIAYQPDVA